LAAGSPPYDRLMALHEYAIDPQDQAEMLA
jgi:hypothetical protein